MYKAIDIARYIINYCNEKTYLISNLKIQKILYYIQLNYFEKYREFLFEDDMIAWNYEPVVLNVYNKYKIFGANEIIDSSKYEYPPIDKKAKVIIEETVEKYISYNVFGIVELIKKEYPYKKALDNGVGCTLFIKYFKDNLKRKADSNGEEC